MMGCASKQSSNSNVPFLDGGQSSIGVEISYDELINLKHITKQVEIIYPGSLLSL